VKTFTEENYLKALYYLTSENGEVGTFELSKHLQIKMPTVTSMMKKFAEKNWVIYESYKPIRLTLKGREEATLIIRKHRLTELFLVEKMGFAWHEVHDIAEQVEHIDSSIFFEKMDEILGYPKFDPHGSPIPDKSGLIERKAFVKLSECSVGERVKLAAVMNSSDEFLKFLNQKEIALGIEIKILEKEEFDNSMRISYHKKTGEFISSPVSEKLLVEKMNVMPA
jgi:DtxR family Mn-dependent transcriptional regulator